MSVLCLVLNPNFALSKFEALERSSCRTALWECYRTVAGMLKEDLALLLVHRGPHVAFAKAYYKKRVKLGFVRRPFEFSHFTSLSRDDISQTLYLICFDSLVYEFSRFTSIEFVRKKSQVPLLLINLLKRLQVRVLRSDNGTEFKNSVIDEYLASVGITLNFSAPRTSQQNGVVERKNRTIIKAARTMMSASGSLVVKRFEKTPYQLLSDKRPNIKFFHVFGCKCYVLNDREPIGKFDPKGDDAIFIGYT
ncbi:hypothetical protein OSB04_028985 [Centaurea solstitialis]|uniref:Integrase catalytic domain-containing protein n=1 Tax=Centaurea solstitialis TaxID=347529 RepID=A0AA38W9V0_9ASTR|nr:hypothetical protein OSB04_028985 [Centaurea solstitialis]